MPKFKEVKVNLKIPFTDIGIEGTWAPDEAEQHAAWEMYVELVTRVSVVELHPNEGLLREALSSLYNLFETTRKILREYGPAVAQPKGGKNLSFGYLAVVILNGLIRPVLSKWHPLLSDYESKRLSDMSAMEHERQWENNSFLREELNKVRQVLMEYARILEEVAGVPTLIVENQRH